MVQSDFISLYSMVIPKHVHICIISSWSLNLSLFFYKCNLSFDKHLWEVACIYPTRTHRLSLGLFSKERITFRKPFRIAICFVIGFVIWTMCIHKRCNRRPNHKQDLRTARKYFVPTAQIDDVHVWLQRAFPKCAHTNHVLKELCVHKG